METTPHTKNTITLFDGENFQLKKKKKPNYFSVYSLPLAMHFYQC